MTPPPPPTIALPAAESVAARLAVQRRAILCVLSASFVFACAAVCIKALEGALPVAQVVFFRNLFALPMLLPLALAAGGLAALRTRNPWGHLWRLGAGLVGTAGSFYGYAHLPLALVTGLNFAMPLFLTALSVPLLGERVGWRRWCAVLVGFSGVMLMLRPFGGGEEQDLGAILIVLLSALAWALSMISIRRMGASGEAGPTIVLWFAIGSAVVTGLATIPVWVSPTPWQWALLATTGLVSSLAQLLMTEGYRRGDSTLVAPFEYAGILWTAGFGALLWSELPDGWDVAGIGVLVASGLYIWHREMRLSGRG